MHQFSLDCCHCIVFLLCFAVSDEHFSRGRCQCVEVTCRFFSIFVSFSKIDRKLAPKAFSKASPFLSLVHAHLRFAPVFFTLYFQFMSKFIVRLSAGLCVLCDFNYIYLFLFLASIKCVPKKMLFKQQHNWPNRVLFSLFSCFASRSIALNVCRSYQMIVALFCCFFLVIFFVAVSFNLVWHFFC